MEAMCMTAWFLLRVGTLKHKFRRMCCGHVSLLAVRRQCQCKREVEDWSSGEGGEQQNPSNRDSQLLAPHTNHSLCPEILKDTNGG